MKSHKKAFVSIISPHIKINFGAAYMLYLAWKTFKSTDTLEENHSHAGFWQGFTLQFINPKIYIYCLINVGIYFALLSRTSTSVVWVCSTISIHRFCLQSLLVSFWLNIQASIFQACKNYKHYYGLTLSLLCRVFVYVINTKM